MKQLAKTKQSPAKEPFIKRMATIVFETNVRQKGNVKATICAESFALSATDLQTYTTLSDHFLQAGAPIVSKSAQDIAKIMPPEVFMEALPRLTKARAITVTFWEHTAAAPKFWRRVASF